MATELENSIKKAAVKIAKYVEDIADLTVETRYVQVGPQEATDFAQSRPVARTHISLDGDSGTVVPMQQTKEGTFEVDQENVATAIEYRTSMMQALLGVLRSQEAE